MLTSWKVFTRDVSRLLRTPKVWIIVVGLMVTPALYSWVNISAFWNPYDNTQNIKVAVVNEDEGADSELTGKLNVGAQVTDQLRDNDRLGWQFMDEPMANEAVRKGEVFAALTIPKEFSRGFVSIFQGQYVQPTVKYQVNEKINAISPKITDQGASTLDDTIGRAFKEKVAEAVATELRNAGGELGRQVTDNSNRAANSFEQTASAIGDSRRKMTDIQDRIDSARPVIRKTQNSLDEVGTTIGDAQVALGQVQQLSADVSKEATAFANGANSAFIEGTSSLADGVASANESVTAISGPLRGALGQLGSVTDGASGLVSQGDQTLKAIEGAAASPLMPPGAVGALNDALAPLQERNAQNQDIVSRLGGLNSDSARLLDSLNSSMGALQDAAKQSSAAGRQLGDAVGASVPKLTNAINNVSATAGQLAASLGAQKTLVGQSRSLLDGVYTQLDRAKETAVDVQSNLSGIEDGLKTASLDVQALGRSINDDPTLGTVRNLDTVKVSKFLASPAEIESQTIFPVNSYGSGMASLFTNLSLWIGAFILLVIFRAEVDTRGFKRLTVASAYTGRYLLLSVIVVCQALIVSIGNLVLGVQSVDPFGYIATCVFIGLCYLSIIYGLVATFGHVGRVLSVVLAFIQIPGASGLYPIEMTPDFFRGVFPLLPFTYGIGAMRETIGGFFGYQYFKYLMMLFVMATVMYIVSIFGRRGLANVNMVVNQELARGGLVVNEEIHTVGSRYRVNDLLAVLHDREGFRRSHANRKANLLGRYTTFQKIAAISGLGTIAILMIVSRVLKDEKAIIFGLACLVTLVGMSAILLLEYIKHNFENENRLSDLTVEELEHQLGNQKDNPADYQLIEGKVGSKHVAKHRAVEGKEHFSTSDTAEHRTRKGGAEQ